MRRLLVLLLIVGGFVPSVQAQLAVFDAAVTTRNSVTAALQDALATVERQQHSQLRRMAQRLSLFTTLAKYSIWEPPLWRIHDFETPWFAGGYHAALNYGDVAGTGYLSVTHPLVTSALASTVTGSARQAVIARLATLDTADAVAIAATHDTGRLRYNGRRELQAIEALDRDVVDPSLEQSATAVLDKISGAVLIAARQRQARTQLLSALVEQLLVDTKRVRDAEAATLNMALIAIRERAGANTALVAGTADALRGWRQP